METSHRRYRLLLPAQYDLEFSKEEVRVLTDQKAGRVAGVP
ncbi:MAG: hypothetical protein OEV30_01045 [Ignavibacteria bacterium]|nr:hypothetical protein [Ignavibacteria bacterium]